MTAASGPLRIEALCDSDGGGPVARQRALPPAAREVHRMVLRAFLNSEADLRKAYRMMVEVPPDGPGGLAERAAQLRLLPRRPDLRFEGWVRETPRPAIEAAGMAKTEKGKGRSITQNGRTFMNSVAKEVK